MSTEDLKFIREEVLKYERGRQYALDIFRFGCFLQGVPEVKDPFLKMLPELKKALRILRSGQPDEIVLTKEVSDHILSVIGQYRKKKDNEFQIFLDRVEQDTRYLAGKTRDECLRYLAQ
jgi:hypothetical protein